MTAITTPRHARALSFAELTTNERTVDVVVLAINEGTLEIVSFGTLVYRSTPCVNPTNARRHREKSLGYEEVYGDYRSSSTISRIDAKGMGLMPHARTSNQGVEWSNHLTVIRSIAHKVLGYTVEEFTVQLANCATRLAVQYAVSMERECHEPLG